MLTGGTFPFQTFPLFITGMLLVPPKVLGASIANKKGIHYSQSNTQQNQSPAEDPYAAEFAALKRKKMITITDDNYVLY